MRCRSFPLAVRTWQTARSTKSSRPRVPLAVPPFSKICPIARWRSCGTQLFKTTAFWRHVHSKNGFLDFEGSPWRARTASDSSSSNNNNNSTGGTAVAAGGDNSSGGGDATEYKPATCCVERLITFKVALSQPVGPKSTRMTQTLVARFVTARRLVIETVSQCHDAPYADSFLVNSMLVVDEKHDGSCHLRIWWGVRFLRTVWMVKGLIESTALRDNQQFYGLWALEALTALHERRIATLGRERRARRRSDAARRRAGAERA
jgi:hypothetical protein